METITKAGTLTATVKAVETKAPGGAGEFEAVVSTAALDRDGEILDVGWWDPLPAEIPIHIDHRMFDVRAVVARAVPYTEDGVLKVKGRYASTPDAQMVRTLVAEGMVTTMSVGYHDAEYEDGEDGVPHLKSAQLLEASFVSVPANTEALVTMAKAADDASPELHQAFHDLAVGHGAECSHKAATGAPEGHTVDPGVNVAPVADVPATENSTADEIPAAGAAKAAPAATGSHVAMAKAQAVMAEAEMVLLTT